MLKLLSVHKFEHIKTLLNTSISGFTVIQVLRKGGTEQAFSIAFSLAFLTLFLQTKFDVNLKIIADKS